MSQQRLASKTDIEQVFANSQKYTSPYFIALYRASNIRELSRLAISIKKHNVRLAVTRNAIRRIVRESFRHNQEMLKGLDILLLMRSKCTPLNKKQLRAATDSLWPTLMRLREKV